MKILLIGNGQMGTLIRKLALDRGMVVADSFHTETIDRLKDFDQPADVLIDFSSPQALPAIADYIQRTKTPLVCGTTGYDEDARQQLAFLATCAPVLYSTNFSAGIIIIRRILREFSAYLLDNGFEAELVEAHHSQKQDVPSGTAKTLLSEIDPERRLQRVIGRRQQGTRGRQEIGIHSLRGGTEAGRHKVIFFGKDEQIEIAHSAESREIFARGALLGAEKLVRQDKGLYTFDQLI